MNERPGSRPTTSPASQSERPERGRHRELSSVVGVADRRGFLRGLAAGGAAALSGCSALFGSRDTDLSVDVEGRAWVTSFGGRLGDRRLGQPTGLLATFAQDVGFGTDPVAREPSFVLAEDYELTPSSASLTLKPDLEWSNGDPLTAADVGRWVYMLRAGAPWMAPVPQVRSGERLPRSSWEGITDVEWDDATVTVRGRFETVPAPLYGLNAQVGRRPRAYYGGLWEDFVAAFDERPWEDDAARDRVTSLVADHLWTVGEERLPAAGIRLEDSHAGDGWKAAYSGLWHPYRTNENHLHFRVNDGHPFSDRVSYDEVVWAFRDEPDATVYDMRSGALDGAMLRNVSGRVTESVPSSVTSFAGQPRGGVSVRFNHSTRRLGDRDVRAALAHVVDRDRLAAATVAADDEAVSVPGADLQDERWVPDEFREQLRPYARDLPRARTLLERAGFRRRGGTWHTPDDRPFEFVVLTDDEDPTVEIALAEQLRSFGIDASMRRIEQTSLQSRLRTGQFVATTESWTSSNASGLPRTRTGEYVRSIARDVALPESAFLSSAVADAVHATDGLRWAPGESGDRGRSRRLAFDSPEALRAIAVEAPPLGEPNGELREWPYVYHAVRAAAAADASEAIEHAKACTWVYNYQLPRLELVVDVPRIFHDTSEWSVPSADDSRWRYVRHRNQPGGLWAALGWGHVDAK